MRARASCEERIPTAKTDANRSWMSMRFPMPLLSSAYPHAVERAGADLGPHRVQILAVEALSLRANRKYSSSTVHFPATVPPQELLACIVIVPGWACSENTIAAWGSFFASQ